MSNLYFHWDITESDNDVCEIESVVTNNKFGPVLMKEYGLFDIKLFVLDNEQLEFKIWFTSDGVEIIPVWCKKLLIEYVTFY
jgi:hypothetical protein